MTQTTDEAVATGFAREIVDSLCADWLPIAEELGILGPGCIRQADLLVSDPRADYMPRRFDSFFLNEDVVLAEYAARKRGERSLCW